MKNVRTIQCFVLVLLLTLSSSCSSIQRRRQSESGNPPAQNVVKNEANKTAEVYGPTFDATTENLPTPTGIAEIIQNPDKIVLVLGPGLSHGYAYVGVLKALTELQIPIHSIYATEVGALAAALYYTQPNTNRIDWALLRFTEKNLRFPENKFSIANLQSPEADLSSKLRDVFGDQRVESFSEKLHIILEDAKTGEMLEAKSGELWRALRGAMAGANGFSPEDFEGRRVKAFTKKIAEQYRTARKNEHYPVVVIGAGAQPPELLKKLIESQKATFLLIPLPGVDNLDIKKRNQAVFSGKNAIHQAANELLGLIGRKTN